MQQAPRDQASQETGGTYWNEVPAVAYFNLTTFIYSASIHTATELSEEYVGGVIL